jgi:adenylyltransferase/sulfurtransferase
MESERYARQSRFAPLGVEGQRRIERSCVLVCGCGALGSTAAELLVRAGVGCVRIVDRDFVELGNLHRQSLFDERDAREHLPKAIAARRRLAAINSAVRIDATVADVTAANLPELARGADAIVDGLDNFDTRYLLNDYAVAHGVPWVFGGCVGAEGQVLAILPGESACLACLLPEPPPAELQPTCESTGVLGPIVAAVASLEAMETLKILSGRRPQVDRRLRAIDLWGNQIRSLTLSRVTAGAGCRACVQRDFPWLEGRRGLAAEVLCGRQAVQLAAAHSQPAALAQLADKLAPLGRVTRNPFLLRFEAPPYVITVFADGRAIVGGASDPAEARAVHARYVGS